MKQAFGALFLGVLAVMLWVYWPRTDIFPGILEATGRVEGDQTAVGAKVCRGIGCPDAVTRIQI